jgi:4-alpha-glucanotransferase
MDMTRCSGILLHITSLPGRYGIGDLGPEAYRFVDYLQSCGQRIWQILPLGPTGFGDSPYQSFSAFAGNPMLISPDKLLEDGSLLDADLAVLPTFSENETEFHRLAPWKMGLLRRAARRFAQQANPDYKEELQRFCQENRFWLDDYALFMAFKRVYEGREWYLWDRETAFRQPQALSSWKQQLTEEIFLHQFIQFQFFRQWRSLQEYAHRKDVSFFGDLPIFVSGDSADVWAQQELFCLDAQGRPALVSGVPPDYFSETGQLWGNPQYCWEKMRENNYQWWIQRFRKVLETADYVRVDHFRGFEAYWEIPAAEKTAVHGRWVKCPGDEMFHRVQQVLGRLPIIAENLGLITPEVEALRERFGFPGMAVLQFAFGGADPTCCHLPHNYRPQQVVYTGTHDNDTTQGWWRSLHQADMRRGEADIEKERSFAVRYLTSGEPDIHWTAIRSIARSVASWMIVPLQDVLGLGDEARMNQPSTPSGNWRWRVTSQQLTQEAADKLREIARLYGRDNRNRPKGLTD